MDVKSVSQKIMAIILFATIVVLYVFDNVY